MTTITATCTTPSDDFDAKFALPPKGDFKLVTYDIMTTGPSLSDDLCSIVAYCPASGKSFSQHIMPYNNLSLGACRRYSLRIISTGRYRVLKDVRNNRVLDTKPDYMALLDFMQFLREAKGDSDGLILLAHDSRKFFSSLLLDVVSKFHLRDEFCTLVAGFANSYAIAEAKCAKPGRSLSLRSLATALLPKEDADAAGATSGEEGTGPHPHDPNQPTVNLADRALTTFKLMAHVFHTELVETGAGDIEMTPEVLSDCLRAFTCNLDGVDKVTAEIRNFRKREESLLPVFSKMRSNRGERQRSYILQRLLAHSNIDYDILSDIYKKGGMDAIQEVLKCTMDKEHAREIEELRHVFALHFDPEYKGQFKPEPQPGAAPNSGVERPASRQGRRFFRRRNSNKKTSGDGGGGRRATKSESQPSSPSGDEDVNPSVTITVTSASEETITAGAAI